MVRTMMKIQLSKVIGIVIGLSFILACSAVAAVDNSAASGALISPGTMVTGTVKENIQKFTGIPNEAITYVGTKELPTGTVYEVITDSGRFDINAKTGEIETAVIRNGMTANSIDARDLAGMREQVKAFAGKNYRNFANKTMVLSESRVIDHGDAGKEYYFVWNEMAGEAYTQNAVQVSIFPDWGNSIAYIGIDRPLLIDTNPKISQTAAQQSALDTFGMSTSAKVQSKLVVIPSGDSQKLAWIVDVFEPGKDNTIRGGTVIINAVSGNVLSTNPIQ
jgi:hypothetical protein